MFRAKVLDALAHAGLALPAQLPKTWLVDCRCVGDGQEALVYLGRYLGRYLYRSVVQERDILRCEHGRVTFQYRDPRTGKMGLRTLDGAEFVWLVLQHVLPRGLRRSRNFGFLHPNSARSIRLLQVVRRRMPALQPQDRPRPNAQPWRVNLPDKPGADQTNAMH